jgi:hypothetical protein
MEFFSSTSITEVRKIVRELEEKKEPDEPLFKGILGIQDHYATQHHWDLRLEVPYNWIKESEYKEFQEKLTESIEKGSPEKKGKPKPKTVLLSFAIPKHRLPKKIGDRLLVAKTLPHSLEYLTESPKEFEIPEGLYGAGIVKLKWKGPYLVWKYEPEEKIVFEIPEGPYKGVYALIRVGKGKKNEEWKGPDWLLV